MRRCDVDKKYTWDLTHMFLQEDEWKKEYEYVQDNLSELTFFKGKLNQSAKSLLSALDKYAEFAKKFERVYVYANLSFHQDMSNTYYQGLTEKADNVATMFYSATSFFNSELISIKEDVLKSFFEEEKELEKYRHHISNIYRQKEHILSEDKEKILALANDITNASSNTYDMLHDADMKFPIVKDEDGNDIELTHSKFISLLNSNNRAIRENAFKEYYKTLKSLKNTLSSTYSGSIKSDIFYSKVRNYNSTLEMGLSQDNIPIEVYENLINTVNKFLPLMHRYISLRKKRLGVDKLHMYDIYAPIVKNADNKVDYEKAKKLVIEGLKPLGENYTKVLEEAFADNWIDVYENENKRSGAYCWGAYGTHPYVLLNYDNKVDDMFTLAHELGHAMHSYLSNETQQYINSQYTIFLAEIASTVNESLLMQHLLKTEEDETTKMYLLNYFLDQFRGTVFRQTMFAEFEMLAHKMAEKGEPINTDSLNELYHNLNVKYYGNDIISDDEIAYEWSRIPHFYDAFYVYQYATGFSCAIAFSKKILEDPSYVDKYLQFLKSGCKDYSLEILKEAGIDMSSPQPIEDALKVFEEILDKMEKAE